MQAAARSRVRQGSAATQRHAPALPHRVRGVGSQRQGAARQSQALISHALLPVAGSIVLAAGAAWLLSQQQAAVEQDQLEASERRPCPSCGGSGLTACMCTRWSDGDVGCSSCSHTGWSKCQSCGGGGMAVPIKVAIRKDL